TLSLSALGLGVAILIGLPLGTLSALRPNGLLDRVVLGISVLGQAMPTFWLGLLLIIFFGLKLSLLPVSGSETWRHMVLPVAVLAVATMPTIMRLTRSGMIDALRADYIRTAKAKG